MNRPNNPQIGTGIVRRLFEMLRTKKLQTDEIAFQF